MVKIDPLELGFPESLFRVRKRKLGPGIIRDLEAPVLPDRKNKKNTSARELIPKEDPLISTSVNSVTVKKEGLPPKEVIGKCRLALKSFVEGLERNRSSFDSTTYGFLLDKIITPFNNLKLADADNPKIKQKFLDLYKIARSDFNHKGATYRNLGVVLDTTINLGQFEDPPNFHPSSKPRPPSPILLF